MADSDTSELVKKEVLPLLRALSVRLDAVEARLSGLESRPGDGGPTAWDLAAAAHAAEEAKRPEKQKPKVDSPRPSPAPDAPPASPAESIVVPAAQLERERRWSWALFGLVAFAILLGVFLATRGSKGGETVSGTITLGPELQGKVDSGDVLFLIARQGEGPPLAVNRIASPTFPLHYSLSQENVMMPSLAFRGEVYVTARISKSGTAQLQKGDMGGACAKNPVSVGAQDADIVIDRVY